MVLVVTMPREDEGIVFPQWLDLEYLYTKYSFIYIQLRYVDTYVYYRYYTKYILISSI